MDLTESEKRPRCATCATRENLKQCSGCLLVSYCSLTCQKQDWPNHKVPCQKQSEIKANQVFRQDDNFMEEFRAFEVVALELIKKQSCEFLNLCKTWQEQKAEPRLTYYCIKKRKLKRSSIERSLKKILQIAHKIDLNKSNRYEDDAFELELTKLPTDTTFEPHVWIEFIDTKSGKSWAEMHLLDNLLKGHKQQNPASFSPFASTCLKSVELASEMVEV